MVGRSCAPRGRPPVIVPARPATARRTAGPARHVGRTCPSADGRSAPLPLSENDGGGPGASTDNSAVVWSQRPRWVAAMSNQGLGFTAVQEASLRCAAPLDRRELAGDGLAVGGRE